MLVLLFLIAATALSIYLVRQQQTLRSKAAISGTGAEFVDQNGGSLPVVNDIPISNSQNVRLNIQYRP